MENQRYELMDLMLYIGMPLANVGTVYVMDGIELLSENQYKNFNELYNEIAKNHYTTANNVEKCIARAFASCRDKPEDYRVVNQYLGYCRTGTAETLIHLKTKYFLDKKLLQNKNKCSIVVKG